MTSAEARERLQYSRTEKKKGKEGKTVQLKGEGEGYVCVCL